MERVQHLRDGIIILDTWPTHVQYTYHLVYIPTVPAVGARGHRAQWLFFFASKSKQASRVCVCARVCACAPAPKVWHLFDFDPAYP